MNEKTTTNEIFGIRLKGLRKQNGYTIEQFAAKIGVAKSTVGYYENENRMPDIEILSRICDVFNVPADYMLGRTNTTAVRGKMKTVCELTGLSDSAADYLTQLVKNRDYDKLSVINHLFAELNNDYVFYEHETQSGEEVASSVLGALFLYFARCAQWEDIVNDFIDLSGDKRKEIFATAYKQYLLNQVTDAVKASAEVYKQDNKSWE